MLSELYAELEDFLEALETEAEGNVHRDALSKRLSEVYKEIQALEMAEWNL